MRVIVAESSGFCLGVERAVEIAAMALSSNRRVWADGPLIHNKHVVEELRRNGLDMSPEGPRSGDAVLVRAHGIPSSARAAFQAGGHDIIDATCPHVAQNQALVAESLAAGRTIVMAGDPDHAETAAALGDSNPRRHIVTSASDVAGLDMPEDTPLLLLAQTTFNAASFDAIAQALSARFPLVEVRKTICRETARRQDEARTLADTVEAMVVVGDRHSANTRRLAEVCGSAGIPVFAVETAAEIDVAEFGVVSVVGVVAGASTPGVIIDDVAALLRSLPGAKA